MESIFDKQVERYHTNCVKWDQLEELYGSKDLMGMWVADSDFACPQPLTDALVKRAQHGIFGYTYRPNYFFEAFIAWNQKRNNFFIKREWMTVTPGVVAAINWAVKVYTEPGDSIIVQPPVYYPFYAAVKNSGRKLLENTLIEKDGYYTMDLESLKAQITDRTKMIILCSPHNPIGRVWTKEELLALTKICVEHNIIIVSDEIHSDLIMPGYKHTSTATLSQEVADLTITCMAPSKTFNVAGLETAVAVIPNEKLRKPYIDFQNSIGIKMSNVFGIEAFIVAYTQCDDWLEKELAYIAANAKYMQEFVTQHLPGFKTSPLEGTYLMWLDCRCLKMTAKELDDFFVQKVKVALDGGDLFGVSGEGFMRFNLATPRANVKQVLLNLENAVKKLN